MTSTTTHQAGPAGDWERNWVQATGDYAICTLAPDGRILSWNRGGERIHGYRSAEIVGQHVSVFYPAPERAAGVPGQALAAAAEHGRHAGLGWRLRNGGAPFWANVVLTALRGDDGTLLGFVEVVDDVSDTKAAHDSALENERQFRLLVQGVVDYAIFMLSPDGQVVSWNPGAERIKGYTAEQIVGSHFSRFYTPEDVVGGVPEHALATARRDGRFEAEGWRVRRDGSRFFAHVVIDVIRHDGAIVGFAKVTRDITERRRAAEQLEQTRAALFQSQKMEALGQLTGGVAHDFNNVLQVLRGNLDLLTHRHEHDPWTLERLQKAVDATERGSRLAAHLLAFGRQQALQPLVVSPERQLRDMDSLLRRTLGDAVEIETVVEPALWFAMLDPHQFENAVLNLAVNAREAMPDGGKLTLELSNETLDDGYVAAEPDVPPGQYVMLAVTDNGVGMSHDVQARAFEPFFSTKPDGIGTGLGLSMAYGFVKQSGGHIRIYSEAGYGTTVKAYFPRSFDALAEAPCAMPETPQRGSETVLVVEDDLSVQSTVIDTLTGLGYDVLKANDAHQALAVIASGVRIDVLFTDVVMPGPLGSPEMARLAKRQLPALKVLFTSGYTRNAIVHGGRLDPGVELLSKPYSRQQLATKLRRMLSAGGEGGAEAEVAEVAEPIAIEPIAVEPIAVEPIAIAPALNGAAVAAFDAAAANRVMVVDDDIDSLEATAMLLEMRGLTVLKADHPRKALTLLEAEPCGVLLTDLALPDIDGMELARQAFGLYPGIGVIFASGHAVSRMQAFDFAWTALQKPFDADQLFGAVEKIFQRA
ncbi:PAS domain S-box protein [Burkholderia sp. Ac-20379]|uniref:PAS domain S-box protein n=1 Tax=Burkholderia sp. Ac-20379 TaxID=2703900 RepID=UPI001981A861|nr:PAS domain S-box protein [Burkholderia sp. Ac-20379]MBN3727896.1 PAS domain S-box protein [Burkholderia sp. Ac-20379]